MFPGRRLCVFIYSFELRGSTDIDIERGEESGREEASHGQQETENIAHGEMIDRQDSNREAKFRRVFQLRFSPEAEKCCVGAIESILKGERALGIK